MALELVSVDVLSTVEDQDRQKTEENGLRVHVHDRLSDLVVLRVELQIVPSAHPHREKHWRVRDLCFLTNLTEDPARQNTDENEHDHLNLILAFFNLLLH